MQRNNEAKDEGSVSYRDAGVDIEAGNEAVHRIKQAVESTFSSNVLTDIGSFGAMYDLKSLMQEYRSSCFSAKYRWRRNQDDGSRE